MKFIFQKTGLEFELHRPTDYTQYVFLGAVVIALVIAVKIVIQYFKEIVVNKRSWMIVTVSIIFLMISGFMWVHIRHPPNSGMSKSKPELFVSGFQQQYAVESQIILIIYVLIAFSILFLAEKVKAIKNTHLQRVTIYFALAVLLVCFSVILRIFYIKSPAYPFKLFF